jgi:hypothetical protein
MMEERMHLGRRQFLYLAGAAVAAPALAQDGALTLLFIRHAEKPDEGWPGPGYTLDGVLDKKKSLVIRGWQRAGAWAALFGAGLGGADYPRPAVIYAANPDSETGKEPSQRPYETIAPLAARLNLKPALTYAVGQEDALVAEITALSGVVLVCWEHTAIIDPLLPALAGGQHIPGLPKKWDGTRYDVVLRLDRAAPGAPWSFKPLFPRLLSGDSDAPLT